MNHNYAQTCTNKPFMGKKFISHDSDWRATFEGQKDEKSYI